MLRLFGLTVTVSTLVFSDVRYLLSPVRLSVCRLSVVCNARAPYTQAVVIFGNLFTTFGTLAVH